MVDTPAQRLRTARKAKGFKHAAEAARSYGWKESTYTSHENGTRGIDVEAAKTYAAAFGMNASDLLGLQEGSSNGVSPATSDMNMVGEVAIGVWRQESMDTERRRPRRVRGVALVPGQSMRQLVKVVDESANLTIMPGEYAIFEPADPEPAANDNVLLYVERSRDGLVERSIRRGVLRKDGRLKLVSHSTHAKFSEDLSYPSSRVNETVTLVGRVVAKHVELPQALAS